MKLNPPTQSLLPALGWRPALWLLFLVTALCQDEELTDGLRKDREALLSLKSKASSFGSSQMDSWRSSGNPCYPIPWKHIKCKDGRVTELDLSNRNVAGTLAVGLRKAAKLEVIDLESNKFTGTIPNDWAKANSFTKLRRLNLANNELNGRLPNFNRRGAWRSLESLDLSSNSFFGGLPGNWLGKYKPIARLVFLDLSHNLLGTTDGRAQATRDEWCQTDTAMGLKAGSGWCPVATPIVGTVDALTSLGLSDNGFVGELPDKWPKIFRRLQYLYLEFNDLHTLDGVVPIPTALPDSWTSDRQRGFPALSVLTLYPGNDYLCSLPDPESGFQDVNLDATYQVADSNGETFGDGNPWLCPVYQSDDNPPTITSGDESGMEWTYPATGNLVYVWGFRVTIQGKDTESEEWSPLSGWTGAQLKIYTLGNDGTTTSDVADQGISCTTGTCTLTFASIDTAASGLKDPRPSLGADPADISNWRYEVTTINLDGVESSTDTFDFTNA